MIICGIDEAGRGPLAGPVVAAAAVFESEFRIDEVRDSKKLKEELRERLLERITGSCIEYSTAAVDHQEIDRINILKATMEAMHLAICGLKNKADIFLIDGNYFRLPGGMEYSINYRTVVKGDDTVFQISAASIIAKVTRDNIMKKYHEQFPEYNFAKHKGYATAEHISRIKEFGLCEIHRRSFCGKFLGAGISESKMHL